MRILFFALIFIFNYSFSFSQNITGNWQGNIEVNGQQIPIVFHFYKDSKGQLDGKWESPSQGAMSLSFTTISANNDSLKVTMAAIGGSYKGKLIINDSIAGMWQQGNASLPLNFKKSFINIETNQKISYPNEREISITSANGNKIFGTLLSKNNHQKLAIIIAGSGPTDRDGNNPLGDKANSYKMLAQALDSQNIASFRFDKRGVAQSISSDFNEGNLVFEDYIKDAEKIFDYLHDTLGFKDIYFLGHSEGSLIGMIASQKKKVKGFVSIAGAGRPIDAIIEQQLSNQPLPDSLKNKISFIFNELKKGKEVNDVPSSLNSLFRKSIQPYMISWLRYSPAPEIKKLNCPVLILQGTCDVQVKIEDAENLHSANKNSTLDTIPLMTHTLKNAEADCKDENNKTYTDASLPLNKELVNAIVNFIKK
jgi:pimeloyl-ACP methyl ester carboxylesterase